MGHAHRRRRSLLCSGSSLATLVLAVLPNAAFAQDADTPSRTQGADAPSQTQQQSTDNATAGDAASNDTTAESPGIIITGVRQALDTAQQIKKNADTVVDSISATDIGAFPDKSASEALQRVPGITVSRLQSADDSTHPSGEPTGVLIRGLTQVRTEFNGRDSFSADAARGLNFNDVSPELLAGVDAYKNQTAEMIEGGIAGTVNLRTRLPFDQNGLLVTGNFRYNYGDKSDRWTPEYSALISDTFDTPIGRFGILGDYAHSKLVTRTESVIMDKIDTYCSEGAADANGDAIIVDGQVRCSANPFGGTGFAYIPDGVRFSQVDYDRKRRGIALAGQYESPTGNVRATVQYLDSKYRNAWLERASHPIFDGNAFGSSAFRPRTMTVLGPAPGTPDFVFGADGTLQSGVITQGHGSFRGSFDSLQSAINTGSAVPGLPFINFCGEGGSCDSLRDGIYFQDEARNFDHDESTQDISANIRWDATDRLHFNFDAQRIDAAATNNDIIVTAGSAANAQYTTGKDGVPQVALLPGSNVNYAPGGLANPHNYWIPFIQGHLEDNEGRETALRGDVEYEFDDGGWVDSLRVGVRYANRSQTVRYSTFNWTPIAAPWNCNGPGFNADNSTPAPYPAECGKDGPFLGYGEGIWESADLGQGFYADGTYPNGELVYLNRDTLRDFDKLIGALSGAATNSPIGGGYVPICDREEATEGCFTPSEILRLKERTYAAYAMMRFGGEDKTIFDDVTVVGNVGLRVIRTKERSRGSVSFPTATNLLNLQQRPCGEALGPNAIVNPACYLTPEILAFANGGGTPDTFSGGYTNWLPSFNVRFGLDAKTFVRFAASRALSRPDIGLLRNFVAIQSPVIDTTVDSPFIVFNSPTAERTAANVTGYNFVFRANSGFAGLKPVTADQFDLSFEHYFGPSSSATLALFYKKLNGSISFGQFDREFANNGSTQPVQVSGPRNEDGGGTLKGLEAAFQTFFDILPDPFDGLGVQLNYTFVDQSNIRNSNLINQTSDGGVGAVGTGLSVSGANGAVIDSQRLAGISKHTFNAVGLYEKGPIGFRVAYNWRSRYLTANLDCCIGLPVFQKAAGFLDSSLRYSLTPNLELSVDASNLLNTRTIYEQQIFGESPATPGATPVFRNSGFSRSDRRYQVGVRVKF